MNQPEILQVPFVTLAFDYAVTRLDASGTAIAHGAGAGAAGGRGRSLERRRHGAHTEPAAAAAGASSEPGTARGALDPFAEDDTGRLSFAAFVHILSVFSTKATVEEKAKCECHGVEAGFVPR